MSEICEKDIKIIKYKIERLIGNVDCFQQDKYFVLDLFFNFDRFINHILINYNLGIENKTIKKFKCIRLENHKLSKFELIKNDVISNIKLKITNNINMLWNYMTKISFKNNRDFYQCLSCIYGTFYGDCFKTHKLSKYSEINIFFAFAIMDNINLKKINLDLIEYYYLIWFMLAYKNSQTKNSLVENFIQFEGKFSVAGLKCAINEIFYTFPYNNIPNENYDDFIFNGFLIMISPFIVLFYSRNKNEIIEVFKSFEESEKLLNLFDKLEKEIDSILIINKGNKEIQIIISLFCIMAFGALCRLNSDKIIKIIKILVNNHINSNIKLYSTFEKWKKVKELIENEFIKYEKDEINKNIYDYFKKEKKKVKMKNTHLYEFPFRLTLYFLYHIKNYKKENLEIDFDKIINEIYSLGGNERENAAIVGTIIGPMVGYKSFGDNLEKFFKSLDKNCFILSPSLMVIFIYYLLNSKEETKQDNSEIYFKYKISNEGYYERNYNTFRMILNFLYNDIKLCDLINLEKKNAEDSFNDTLDFLEENSIIKKPNTTKKLFSNKLIYENNQNDITYSKSVKSRNLEKINKNQNNSNISDFNFNEIKETKETENKFMDSNNKQLSISSSCLIY